MFYVREADRADGPQGSLATEIGHVGPRVAVRALADAVDVLLRQAVHLIRHQVHDDLLAGLGVFRRTEIILEKNIQLFVIISASNDNISPITLKNKCSIITNDIGTIFFSLTFKITNLSY